MLINLSSFEQTVILVIKHLLYDELSMNIVVAYRKNLFVRDLFGNREKFRWL